MFRGAGDFNNSYLLAYLARRPRAKKSRPTRPSSGILEPPAMDELELVQLNVKPDEGRNNEVDDGVRVEVGDGGAVGGGNGGGDAGGDADLNAIQVDDIAAMELFTEEEWRNHVDPTTAWGRLRFQIISCTIISFAMMHTGMTISFPNLLVQRVKPTMISNFAGIGALSTPIGSFITSMLTDRFGRKRTLMLLELGSVLTWFTVAVSDENNSMLFYAGGALAGISRGALTSHCSTFISEVADNQHRQMFLSFITFFFTVGYCLTSSLRLCMTWRDAAICFGSIFTAVTILTLLFVQESPHWFAIIVKNLAGSKKSLKHYHPRKRMLATEWTVLQRKVETIRQMNKNKPSLFSLIKRPTVYKPSIILLILLFFQQACCIYPLSAYTLHVVPLLGKSQGLEFKYHIFIVISAVRLVISFGTTIFLSKFNQKQLLKVSFIGMLIFSMPLVGLKIKETLTESSTELLWNDWLMIISFVLYTASGCIGAVGIPWTIIFELLPTEVRGRMGPYFVAFGYVIMSIFLKSFFSVLSTIGTAYIFLIIGLVSLGGSVFVSRYVPETRGRTLYDIENRFANRN